VGSRAGLNAVVKRKFPALRRESNPRTPIVQPVAQRYAKYFCRLQPVVLTCGVTHILPLLANGLKARIYFPLGVIRFVYWSLVIVQFTLNTMMYSTCHCMLHHNKQFVSISRLVEFWRFSDNVEYILSQ
jgi:hypothetical protein